MDTLLDVLENVLQLIHLVLVTPVFVVVILPIVLVIVKLVVLVIALYVLVMLVIAHVTEFVLVTTCVKMTNKNMNV